ncbi:hypothetical protein F7725_003283 [Dissostichus mawsoni]|uniref:EGF-like domain-containing protein n=1 Tax=Dissostichus mawsoni TaxID=36200 RepID=A0A7J5Y9W6_DISMA|nr:hypothetical protein F7725_003283 [Dissostichus mawsoni]
MAGPAVGVLSVGARGFRRRGGHENFHPPVLGGGSPPCLPSSERGPLCPLSNTGSINNSVKIHGASRVDGALASSVNIGYQPKVSGLGPASIDLTFRTKPQDPLWLPFSKLPAPPFSFEIYSPAEGERRGGGGGHCPAAVHSGFRCLDKFKPCDNGGTCLDSPSRCICRPGFIGPLCQQQDPCNQSPCLNGAACKSQVVNGIPQFTCVCQRGFRGKECSLIDACATSPCANGARCAHWNNHYNCSCPPGFQGKNCRSDIDECRKPGMCLNGGLCMNTHGSFRCQCQPGYSGRTCEVSVLPCAPSQCMNGGTCRQTSDHSYECACLPGFEGHNCENNVDDCPGHKCMNGGICVDGVNTYNCQCAPEWTGTAQFTSYLK